MLKGDTHPTFVAQHLLSHVRFLSLNLVAQHSSLNISLIWATKVVQHFANGAVWLVN